MFIDQNSVFSFKLFGCILFKTLLSFAVACRVRLLLLRAESHLLLSCISHQTVKKKSFHGAASVIKTPAFVVTRVTEACTATAASGNYFRFLELIFLTRT